MPKPISNTMGKKAFRMWGVILRFSTFLILAVNKKGCFLIFPADFGYLKYIAAISGCQNRAKIFIELGTLELGLISIVCILLKKIGFNQ